MWSCNALVSMEVESTKVGIGPVQDCWLLSFKTEHLMGTKFRTLNIKTLKYITHNKIRVEVL